MSKLSFKKRVWVVKQYLNGISVQKLALMQGIHRRCVYQIIEKYNIYGWDGLKDHKTGRPETVLNTNIEIIILDLRKRYGYGACRIETVLKRKGFGVSHRQIEKLLLRNGLVEPNIRKQRPRKWVRYELPNPNDLWHTDWSYDPFSGMNLSVYLDDRTRLITSYGLFKKATTENTVALLKTGIACFGKPKVIMTDNGTQYRAARMESKQENTQFRISLDALGIKHYLTRIKRPQTNGKVERFFLTYKTEYATGSFNNLKEFITHYNHERPHMSLNNRTPQETWNELRNV